MGVVVKGRTWLLLGPSGAQSQENGLWLISGEGAAPARGGSEGRREGLEPRPVGDCHHWLQPLRVHAHLDANVHLRASPTGACLWHTSGAGYLCPLTKVSPPVLRDSCRRVYV